MIPAIVMTLIFLGSNTPMRQDVAAQAPLRLPDLELIALERNPVLAQAAASIRAAEGLVRQAALYPNPFVAVENPDLSYGPTIRGGEWGVVVEQDIVLGGKLGLSRQSAEQNVNRVEAEAERERLQVLTMVRRLFYRALAVQKRVDVRQQLVALLEEAVVTSRQLQNVGQADLPDVLEIEIEHQQADLALMSARNEQRQVWVQLASAIGDPGLTIRPLAGDLERIPEIDAEQTLARLLTESPEIKAANAAIANAEFALERARKEAIPDLSVRGGIHYNRELLEAGGRPIGTQGSIAIGVRLPIFNRNQGNVSAAQADLDRARLETDRVALSLRSRLAGAMRRFEDARDVIQKYRDEMLPRARQAYELYLARFRQMAAAYPQALIAQRTLLQLQGDYDDALGNLWQTIVEIEGLLVEGELRDAAAGRDALAARRP